MNKNGNNVVLCNKACLYKHIKVDFGFENYLVNLPWPIASVIVKFRTVNHKLAIETGRYININREFRYCELCNMNKLGDEYHLFFECVNANVVRNRERYLPNVTPNMFGLISIMKSINDKSMGSRIASFFKVTDVI